jgi:hypothetical protein
MTDKPRQDWRNRLESALDGATDWYDVERALKETVTDDEIEDARPLVYAFGYMLLEPRREESRDRHGTVFAPRIEWGNGQAFPAPLDQVDDAIVQTWASWADEFDDPVALSRFHDLLWERRHGERPDRHARVAADAYLDLAESGWEPLDRAFCAVRALELARSVNDEALTAHAIQACVRIADEELSLDERRPGITLRAIEALADLPAGERPPGLAELLARARERYSPDPWIEQSISDIEASIAPSEDRSKLYLEQVRRWREEAAKATGITRFAHLQHALGLAQTHGFKDEADQILQAIQSLTPEDLDLKPISVEVKVPTEAVDAYIAALRDLPSWQEALTSFGLQGPPTGRTADVDARVAELAKDHPLLGLIPRQVIGSDSSLVWSANTPEDHARVDRAQHEALSIRVFSRAAARILDAIGEQHRLPGQDELAGYFGEGGADAATADQLADGAARFWTKDFTGATHLLAPAVEARIRSLAASVGVVVIRQPRGETPGGVRPLGGIIADLSGRMDESWRRYLANALTDQLGVNLRNDVAHALGSRGSVADAALLIHIACYLRVLVPGKPSSS